MNSAIPQHLLDAYRATTIEVILPGGTYRTSPADHASAGPYPAELAPHCWILTSHNPGSEVLSGHENATRNAELLADIVATGCPHFAASGRSPDGAWHEASFAVVGLSDASAMALARAYGQLAAFRIEPDGARVVGVGEDR
jgi:hypothetical protein